MTEQELQRITNLIWDECIFTTISYHACYVTWRNLKGPIITHYPSDDTRESISNPNKGSAIRALILRSEDAILILLNAHEDEEELERRNREDHDDSYPHQI